MKKPNNFFTDHGKMIFGLALVTIGVLLYIYCTINKISLDDTGLAWILGTGLGLTGWHTWDHLSDPPTSI